MMNKLLVLSLLTLVACAKEKLSKAPSFHLDPQMTSNEYHQLLLDNPVEPATNEIESAIFAGERMMKWTNAINAKKKAEGVAIVSLTSKEGYQNSGGIPIEKPSIMSVEILRSKMQELLKTMPDSVKSVITGSGDLPLDTGVEEAVFLKNARAMSFLYQMAARLKLLTPYMPWYKNAQAKDVRGYYYLTKEKIDGDKLRDLSVYDEKKMAEIKTALVKVCLNSGTLLAACKSALDENISSNTVADYYAKYFPAGEKMWNGFFDMPAGAPRKDLTWSDNKLTVPFNHTQERLETYLKVNIEDEYKFNGWNLELLFGDVSGAPELQFQKGVTPHVNKVGGNYIIMDENESIDEWSSKWVIRHEFGHVLGFVDCYHEFFDEELGAFVNYQLDVKDLMCSRSGKMNERIYKGLEKAYSTTVSP